MQSLWEAAKTIIKFVVDSFGHALFGRRKRELMHEALLKTHQIIRSYRNVDLDADTNGMKLNETIDIVFETAGFKNATSNEDYENRVAIFRRRCTQFQNIVSFLNDANDVLFDIANETYTTLKAAADIHDQLDTFDIDKIRSNFTLANSGIDPHVALRDFNISTSDLDLALSNANESFKNDRLLAEIQNTSQLSKTYLKESTRTAESIRILDQWIITMENLTNDYFENDVCVSFLDCAHHSMAELLDLYYAEEFDNVSDIFNILSSIEDTFLELVSNSSHPIQTVYNLSGSIRTQLAELQDMNPYCSVPPTILSQLTNQTVASGDIVQFYCNVSGNPEPTIWWYKDDEYLPGEHEKSLTLENVTATNITHKYKCIAGNVVANLSSDDAYLDVEDELPFVTVTLDQGNNGHGLLNPSTTEQVVITKKLPSNADDSTDLRIVLIPTLVSLFIVGVVAVAVLWRSYIRKKFQKDKTLGSFASLNMVRPTSAAKHVYRSGQPVSMTEVEQF